MKFLCFLRHAKRVQNDSHIHDTNYTIHSEKSFSWGDYDDDIDAFCHLDECVGTPKGYKVDCDMRKNMIDWLIDTHYGLALMPETLYLCVNILDRFLSKTKFNAETKKDFELVGITSLLLASKYVQHDALSVYELEIITQYSCSIYDILHMENVILQKLDWVLTVPTPYVFLLRNMRVCLLSEDDKIMENMVFFISELSLTHYPIMGHYRSSIIAASTVYCARIIVGRFPFWSKNLMHCTGYSRKKLSSCTKVMFELCNAACRDGNMDVFWKFSSPDYCKVACIAQQEFSKNHSDLRILLNMGRHHLFNLNVCQKNLGLMFLCGC